MVVFSIGSLLSVACPAILRPLPDAGNIREERGRVAVAVQACAHRKFGDLPHNIHILHFSVAVHAVDAAVDVNAMIEVRVIGNLVDPLPWQSGPFFVILCQFDDLGFVLTGHTMAVHADGNGGNGGVRRDLGACMTILAIDLHRSGVELMGKRDRLYRSIPDPIAFRAGNKVRRGK